MLQLSLSAHSAKVVCSRCVVGSYAIKYQLPTKLCLSFVSLFLFLMDCQLFPFFDFGPINNHVTWLIVIILPNLKSQCSRYTAEIPPCCGNERGHIKDLATERSRCNTEHSIWACKYLLFYGSV
jgi:hypothetical protein